MHSWQIQYLVGRSQMGRRRIRNTWDLSRKAADMFVGFRPRRRPPAPELADPSRNRARTIPRRLPPCGGRIRSPRSWSGERGGDLVGIPASCCCAARSATNCARRASRATLFCENRKFLIDLTKSKCETRHQSNHSGRDTRRGTRRPHAHPPQQPPPGDRARRRGSVHLKPGFGHPGKGGHP